MSKLKAGLVKAISSVVVGFITSSVIAFLAGQGLIPSYSVFLLAVVNLLLSVLTLFKMRRWGLFYMVGWLSSSILFAAIGMLDIWGIILNIAVPVAILVLRMAIWLKRPVIRRKTRSR